MANSCSAMRPGSDRLSYSFGLIDNLLQPALVEGKLHVHLVPVFVSIVGGVYAFGGVGLVIGPAILAVALALLDIWRLRVAEQKV